jgi:putative ABC transport system permease protein
MKLILRNFITILKRFRTSSILNILGLAIAYAVFYLIAVQVYYDFSFDRNFEKANSIFMYTEFIPDNPTSRTYRAYTNATEAKDCAEKYPEVKNFCYFVQYKDKAVNIKDSIGNDYSGITVTHTSIGLLDMFEPKILAGDVRQALTVYGKAILTENVAKRLFGNADPMGKQFFYWNQPVIVTAIIADFPDNCSLKNGVYFYQHETPPSAHNYTSYLELDPKNKDKLQSALNKNQNTENKIHQYELIALPQIYLHCPEEGEGNFTATISLLVIGILLLIISYINFLNFYMAVMPIRIRGFNIRRIFGESDMSLKLSIIMEAVFLSFIAFLASILFINLIKYGVHNFFTVDTSISQNFKLLCFVGIFSMLSGFMAGMYPAFYSTSFKPAMVISGSFAVSRYSKWLKNILIGAQFVTAIFFVIITIFVKIQHDYMQNKDWGIATENILYFNMERIRNNIDNMTAELKNNPDITDITHGLHFPGQEGLTQSWGLEFEGIQINTNVWYVNSNFLDFFSIRITEGRGFEEYEEGKAILNRAFIKEYGFNDIIGKEFSNYEIVGISEDFNFKPLRETIKPMALISSLSVNFYNWTFVKTTGMNTQQTIDYIRDTWKKFSNEPLDIRSMDKTLDDLYRKENNLAKLISTCGAIAIIVAIMGVYGLILFNAKSKRKMIALHKVNGASKTDVILLLNRGFLMQFTVAYVIAVPTAYYVVNRWLENFAYKTPIHWWVFVAGGLSVLLITVFTVSWQSYKAASVNPIEAIKSE